MTQVIQFVIDVLSLGGAYALMALGLVIVYGILRLVNFAYGELIMVAGYTLFLVGDSALPWLVMAAMAVLAAIATGIATDYVAFRPVRAKSVTAVLITSFAFSTLLQNAALLFISPRPRNVPLPDVFSDTIQIAGVITPVRNVLTIVTAAVMLTLFAIVMKRTMLGIAMRAAASQFTMARMLGVPANLVISTAFAISGLLAGVVALFWLGRSGTVVPGIGLEPLLVAFIATVIGGMRSLQGAVVGGFLLAFIDTGLNYSLPQNLLVFRDAFTFSLVILILLVASGRPDPRARHRPKNLAMLDRKSWITLVLLLLPIGLLVLGVEASGVRVFERIAINLCISLILVVGLQVFMGNSGILSFAHIGFMGVGAYTSAVLSIPAQMKGMALPDLYPIVAGLQLSPYLSIAIGGLVAAAVAALVAYPLMRLSDAAAVITSFALLVVLHTIMLHWSEVTNGPRTLFGLPKLANLYLTAAVAGGAVVVAVLFKESRTGVMLRASRDDETAAAAMGTNIPLLRWRAFILSALIAGIAGGLWGHFITSFSPKAFYLKETFVILGMLVIGGTSTVSGAVFGCFVVTFAFEGLRSLEAGINRAQLFTEQVVGLTEVSLALAMIGILILRPGGLFATAEIGAGRLFRRKPTA